MIPSTGTVHPSEPSWDRTLATFEEMQVRCCLIACTEQVQAFQHKARQQGSKQCCELRDAALGPMQQLPV